MTLDQTDLFGEVVQDKPTGALAAEFKVPPFSVLNARGGWWQRRKKLWLSMGLLGEVVRGTGWKDGDIDGRRTGLAFSSGSASDWQKRSKPADSSDVTETGTSLFDPVLAELLIRWFSPPGGIVIDPFAGGAVRGVVSGYLGRRYVGVDLRPEQVESNRGQAEGMDLAKHPTWVEGDCREVLPTLPPADFILTCPPYGDLEIYSDRPGDLSNMDWWAFLTAYRAAIAATVDRMKADRFAAVVVGDFRDRKTGLYRNFVSETAAAFCDAGAALYNEAILITPAGSLPIRAGAQFRAGRKLGKTHQNVLVFVKGDWRKAAKAVNR
ncbi:MAG: DNA methyltransferase [Planctomycetota bacterium]|jgi:hypothetical protein